MSFSGCGYLAVAVGLTLFGVLFKRVKQFALRPKPASRDWRGRPDAQLPTKVAFPLRAPFASSMCENERHVELTVSAFVEGCNDPQPPLPTYAIAVQQGRNAPPEYMP